LKKGDPHKLTWRVDFQTRGRASTNPRTVRDVYFVAIATMAAAAAMNIIESRKYGNGVMYGR